MPSIPPGFYAPAPPPIGLLADGVTLGTPNAGAFTGVKLTSGGIAMESPARGNPNGFIHLYNIIGDSTYAIGVWNGSWPVTPTNITNYSPVFSFGPAPGRGIVFGGFGQLSALELLGSDDGYDAHFRGTIIATNTDDGAGNFERLVMDWQATPNVLTLSTTVGGVGTILRGMLIGALASNPLAFFGNTPVIQPSTTGTMAGFTQGTGSIVMVGSTFTGGIGTSAYTQGDMVNALKKLGLMAM